jgi:hypothetical protein
METKKSMVRLILMKVLGVILAVFFLAITVLMIGYPLISLVSTLDGVDAKVVEAKVCVNCKRAGLYNLTVLVDDQKFKNVRAIYPQWGGHAQPMKGDVVKIWPQIKPRVAAVETEGWAWTMVGGLLLFGVVMLEFVFLAISLR